MSRPDPEWTLTLELRISGRPDPVVLDLIRDLREVIGETAPVQTSGQVVRIDPLARSATQGTRQISLSRIEFDLLLFLARHPGQAFTRAQLIREVWGSERGNTRTVDVHVRRLRAKAGDIPLVTTVRAIGYRLADGAAVHVVEH
jgi:two-component system, OmpR family, response regulator MtrA